MEARRRGGIAQGAEAARESSTCHFGRKPRNGGSPARERKDRDKIVFCGGDRVVKEIIFVEVRAYEASVEIMVKVVNV